ncbi:MAG: FAD-dependent oxidoreductase [Cyclobacteriaceae bacterium]
MNRRDFIEKMTVGSALLGISSFASTFASADASILKAYAAKEYQADLIIAGGGIGGFAAALSALRNGLQVILTEETNWIGGQLTQQGVPPDEHQWIETHGAPQSYRYFREAVRTYYKRHYPLTEEARLREQLNPGDGAVSRLCHEPRVALSIMESMLAPYISAGKFILLIEHKATAAEVEGDRVKALVVKDLSSGKNRVLSAPYFVDATELGDLLPLSGTEFVEGAESKVQTGELHAADEANPRNQQAFTMCFAMDYVPDADLRIDKPRDYDFWRNYVPDLTPPWPGKLLSLVYANPVTLQPRELGFHPEGVATGDKLNLWNYRRIINRQNFTPGFYSGDITIVNWPQNDYLLGTLTESETAFEKHVEGSKQLGLSLFYWLQTEVPRLDGGQGWPGLRLRGDVMGTEDGMAKYPYVREARRIKAEFTVLEEHVGIKNRIMVAGKEAGQSAANFYDSVGIGYYRIDLHPSTAGDNYIDFASLPFQIPLGSLLPQRMENLIPVAKNIGTTHVTNGCYRLHPVEWGIGEAAGMLISFALEKKVSPRAVRAKTELLQGFQRMIRAQGVETHWPNRY